MTENLEQVCAVVGHQWEYGSFLSESGEEVTRYCLRCGKFERQTSISEWPNGTWAEAQR
jgi:hypothetical protein